MPHVIVKLWPGKTEEQKKRLAKDIARSVASNLDYKVEFVSVAMEEIGREDWTKKVYEPEIQTKWDKLYHKPGYKPSDYE